MRCVICLLCLAFFAVNSGQGQNATKNDPNSNPLWGYQPVRRPTIPDVAESIDSAVTRSRNPIDRFIAAKWPAGLTAAGLADRRTLIRRAAFDLTGLPPEPELARTFLADPDSDEIAFSKVVDRLLESPHYGERMAQHWLDVVRYADSSGFANDYERGNAWRYRDYVVRAFNNDKPYDQFIREQIAGDELHPGDPEMQIAVGFLRMGPGELTGMEVAKVARQRFLDDVVNSVGETFLAHSLQCARCHDHKFDPIPTRDYYSIQAVFATTQLAELPAAFLPQENKAGFEEQRFLAQRRDEYIRTLQELDQTLLTNADQWFHEIGKNSTLWKAAVEKARNRPSAKQQKEFSDIFGAARGQLLKDGVSEDEFPPKLVGFTPAQFGLERVARKGLERLRWEQERYQPFALSVYNGRTPELRSVNAPLRMPANSMSAGELEETCVLSGGDPFSKQAPVSPGILSAVSCVPAPNIPTEVEGRRLPFANWVASPDNPLTTRTMVNRLWLWHFNQPIAGNPNNFGSTGKRPTHPELLDWLSAEFVDKGWSVKAMHRLLMNSETYRRSSQHPEPSILAEKDPEQSSYAVFSPRRLTGEELRDAMLVATDELNRDIGGIPKRPEINPEAALQPRQVMGTFASAWVPNPLPSQRHRRSLYSLKLRGLTDPFLEVFNSPAPDFSCERREASAITPQVFSLLNGKTVHDRALALAHRAIKDSDSDQAAITECFERALSRMPRPQELALCLEHWKTIEAMIEEAVPPTEKPPLEIRREAVEENTGDRFTYMETLYSNAEFVPDLQPHDADRHTRALADVCLAIFNSNEFAYVD